MRWENFPVSSHRLFLSIMPRNRSLLCMALVLVSTFGLAQPDFTQAVELEGVRCFRDAEKSNVAYYSPGGLGMVVDRNEKPDFNFFRARYTGNAAYNDKGEIRFLSILRFKVKMEQIPAEKLSRIKKGLWPSGSGQLKPVPITDIKTTLAFLSVEPEEDNSDQSNLLTGDLSAQDADGFNGKGVFWKEREFTIKLDKFSTQLLDKAFEKGQSLMSLSYAFFSKGINQTENSFITEGENEVLDAIREQVELLQDSIGEEQVCIRSDAFSIVIDSKLWPDLIRQIDINEEVPPGYAALEVRCYDFNNNLRPDLFAKKIEIKATGVGRGDVLVKSTFNRKSPDIYVYNVKFPYAVRLDRPLYYRVTSVSDEAAPLKTDWIEQDLWTGMIDITSSEDQVIEIEEE